MYFGRTLNRKNQRPCMHCGRIFWCVFGTNVCSKACEAVERHDDYVWPLNSMDKELVIRQHLPMVWGIAIKIWRNVAKCRGDAEDLFQEGICKLINAIDHYNPDHDGGAKFITFAYICVSRGIKQYILLDKTVRVPIAKIASLKEEESEDERWNYLVNKAKQALKIHCISELGDPYSSNKPFDIEDKTPPPEDYDKDAVIYKELDKLSERQRNIIKMRFDGDGKTLDEIGEFLGISKERVRQIQNKGLNKLLGSRTFRDYYQDYIIRRNIKEVDNAKEQQKDAACEYATQQQPEAQLEEADYSRAAGCV